MIELANDTGYEKDIRQVHYEVNGQHLWEAFTHTQLTKLVQVFIHTAVPRFGLLDYESASVYTLFPNIVECCFTKT